MDGSRYRFKAELWRWEGGSWYFVTVPPDASDEIEATAAKPGRGFGSVRVSVTIGATTWATSVFPDTKRGGYLLPVKKSVREREGIDAGDRVIVSLQPEP